MAVHPEYDADTVDNDVALLRLPVTLSPAVSRGIACLPAPKQELPTNKLCTIIGWGKTRSTDDFGTDILHEAKVLLTLKVVLALWRFLMDFYEILGGNQIFPRELAVQKLA